MSVTLKYNERCLIYAMFITLVEVYILFHIRHTTTHISRDRDINLFGVRQIQVGHNLHKLLLGFVFSQSWVGINFIADRRTQAAVLYEIIVIGEAANRLSDDFRAQHANIPWKEIVGMRNILAHQYDKVDADEVWNVVHRDLPILMAMIQPLLSD